MSFHKFFADGTPDLTHPNQKGFRFAEVDDVGRIAADASYEQMRTRLDYRHRQQDGDCDARALTLDESEQAAAATYTARSERLQSAWKTRDG